MKRLKSKLSRSRRTAITMDVYERGLKSQLWLRSQGFLAIAIRGDEYRFVFNQLEEVEV